MTRNQVYLRKDQNESIDKILKEIGYGTMAQFIRTAIDNEVEKYNNKNKLNLKENE